MKDKTIGNTLLIRRPWSAASVFFSLVCMIGMILVFNFPDGRCNLTWSLELLDCLFGKADTGFYRYTATASAACCDKSVIMIFPLSVWNLPLWIIREVTGSASVTGFAGLVWMKAGFLLCIMVTAYECTKIVRIINPDADSFLVVPLILASFDIMCSAFYAGQDEIVYLMILVMALRMLLEDKRKYFLAFGTLAATLNPEMIIPVLLMILFSEKEVLYALLKLVTICIPNALFELIYKNDAYYHQYSFIQSVLVRHLFGMDIGFAQRLGNVSLFALVVFILLFVTLVKKDLNKYDLIWILTAAMVSMSLLSSGGDINAFYRSLLYVPFMVMLTVSSRQNTTTGVFLYGLYACFRGWLSIITDPINNMSAEYMVRSPGTASLGELSCSRMPILGNYGLITAVCLALALIIMAINLGNRQDMKIEIFRIDKEMMTFVFGLFAPLILFSYIVMCT